MTKLERSAAQHCTWNEQYCIAHLKTFVECRYHVKCSYWNTIRFISVQYNTTEKTEKGARQSTLTGESGGLRKFVNSIFERNLSVVWRSQSSCLCSDSFLIFRFSSTISKGLNSSRVSTGSNPSQTNVCFSLLILFNVCVSLLILFTLCFMLQLFARSYICSRVRVIWWLGNSFLLCGLDPQWASWRRWWLW